MSRKFAKNEKGERFFYSEKDREEIRRGVSTLNPKYLDYTVGEFKAEAKKKMKTLRRALRA